MVRLIFYALTLLSVVAMAIVYPFWPEVIKGLYVLLPIIGLGFYDVRSKHNILRNYPIIGHLRYFFESIRPEIQQYFIATNLSDRPYNRQTRDLIYQRAKNIHSTLAFGTQHDVHKLGYLYAQHSLRPSQCTIDVTRINIGNDSCRHPYHASRLNISGMSFGALSPTAVEAMNLGAKMGNFAQNTGEGGISPYHLRHGGDLIWQIGSGYFGCRDEHGNFDPASFQDKAHYESVKMIEIKLSQGAKPAHGGILPGIKVNHEIAATRGVPTGVDCLSPAAHPAFSTPLELLDFVARLRELSGGKPIGIKFCLGKKHEFMALCKAMLKKHVFPDFITIDGSEGGTGAAPLEFSNHIGTPLNEALIFVNNCLIGCGLRSKITLIASGKIAKSFDLICKIALGADVCHVARPMMFAVGCIQSLRCDKNNCPTGVATQNKYRYRAIDPIDKGQRVANFHINTLVGFTEILNALGIEHPSDISPEQIRYQYASEVVKTFADLYPQLEPDQLLSQQIPEAYARDWSLASESHF